MAHHYHPKADITAVNVTDDTDGVLCLLLPSYCGEAMCYYVPKQVYVAECNCPLSLYHIVNNLLGV